MGCGSLFSQHEHADIRMDLSFLDVIGSQEAWLTREKSDLAGFLTRNKFM